MRVVFLTHNYPRHAGDLPGSFLATLAQALRRRGTDVRVVAPSDEGRGGDEVLEGVPVRRVRYAAAGAEVLAYRGTMRTALRRPGGWRALAGLWRALRRGAREEIADGADLVHAHWWVPAALAAPASAPVVITCHGTDVALLRSSRLARAVARPVFHRARVVTAVSRDLAVTIQNAVSVHLPAEHISPMPVESDALPWSQGGGGAVVVSRLTPQKRVHLALEAVACLAALEHHLPLTIVGDGPERRRLESRATALGIAPLVHFVGAVAHRRIGEHLARADLMFFPARAEGFGLVAAEALMAGVPVVACWDGGGALDVVPEQGAGRLVIPSAEALADAALDLLQHPDRQAVAREAGESWRHRLAPDAVAAVCERWYAEALGA